MVRTKLSRLFPVVAASAGVLALSACGSGGTAPAANSSAPSSSETSATTTVTTAVSSPSSSAPAAPPVAQPVDNGLCKAGDVQLSLGQGDAGAGSVYRPLLIKNVSAKPCILQGFPGVSYVAGADGHQVGKD